MSYNTHCKICGVEFKPPSPRRTCSYECSLKARTGRRKQSPKPCVVCGQPRSGYWSKTCSKECAAILQFGRGEILDAPCVFVPFDIADYDSMIATLERKGYVKVNELTEKSSYEYISDREAKRITWWDKSPSPTSVDGKACAQEKLTRHRHGVEPEAKAQSADTTAEQELQVSA